MSYRLKTANVASLILFTCTAFVMGGVSMADDSIPPIADVLPAPFSSPAAPISRADPVRKISFAPLKEVVQPLRTAGDAPNLSAEGSTLSDDGDAPASLAALVAATDTRTPLDKETQCLATAVFYEARSESLEGQLAVARVIINRSHSPRFAESLCAVITQPRQFSFVRGGKIPAPRTTRPAWNTAIAIARIAQNNAWESKAEGALYFHARYVSPAWRRTRLAAIDNHIFYR